MIGNGREQLRIACIGGGPAGLYFAILAKRQDPASVVTVYERSPEDVTYGWGVVFWDDLLSDLRATDPETARLLAEGAFQWFDQVLDVDGRTPTRLDASGYSIGRRQLLEILNGRAREVGVDLRFVSEVSEPAALPDVDLVVAADGVNSQLRTMRRGTFGTRESLGRNRYVWLGTTRRFDNFTFGFTETHAGWIWFHAYGFDTDRSTLIVECSPETWARLRFDTLDAEASLRRLEQIFARQLGGHRLITQTSEGSAVPWLRFRRVTNERWNDGNLVLLGDAAHTTHFSIGSGTRLAMQDAIALADALRSHATLPAALGAYGARRRTELARAQSDARYSARYFEHIPRYARLDSELFLASLVARRSPLLVHLPPRRYLQLQQASLRMPMLRHARRILWPRAKALLLRAGEYGRR